MSTLVPVFSDDFSSYGADIPVKNLPDYDVYAFNASESLKTTGTGEISLTAGTNLVYGHDVGSVNHYSKVTLGTTPTQSAYNRIGAAVRIVGFRDFIGVATGANKLRLFVANSSGNTYLQDIEGITPVINDVIELRVLNNIVTILVNDVVVGNPEDISSLTQVGTATMAGGSAGNQIMLDAATAIEVGTITPDALIAIDEFDTATINVDFSATGDFATATGDFNITGTYVDTTPSAMEYRLVDHETPTTVIKDWGVLDANPSGNTFGGTITNTKTKFCFVEVRSADNQAEVVRSSGRVGFGLTLWFDGQSNINSLKQSYPALVADTSARLFNTAVGVNEWQSIDNNTMGLLANKLVDSLDCAITIGMTGVDGSSITQHNVDPINPDDQLAIDAMNGSVGMYVWGQGESDVGIWSTYYNELTTRRSQLLTRQGKTATQLPMAIVQLGRHSGGSGSDFEWSQIRRVQTEFAEASDNVFISHQGLDLDLFDNFHRSPEGAATEVLRLADSILNHYGYLTTTGNGAFPTAAIIGTNTITLNHNMNGGSSLTVPVGAHYLYEVSNDDFTSNIIKPTSAITVSTYKIQLTFASLPTGELKIRSHQYQDFTLADLPISDKVYEGGSTMVAPITTGLLVTIATTSTVNLTATGYPDGVYAAEFYEATNPLAFIQSTSVTMSDGESNGNDVDVPSGTTVYTRIDGDLPPSTGVTCYGVTE